MMRIIRIFRRDVLAARRDNMLLYILIVPVIMGLGIFWFSPGITDSNIQLVLTEQAPSEQIAYMNELARVQVVKTSTELERRVQKQDDAIGIMSAPEGDIIIRQGNESDQIVEYAKLLNAMYHLGMSRQETNAKLYSFAKTVPPLRNSLLNMLISMIVMLTGMVIALGLVEEKADHTIQAIAVTPVSKIQFVIGKSLLGAISALVSIVIVLLILGYQDINWAMMLLMAISAMGLTMIIGFLQGVSSKDIMEAASGVKIMMLPIAGSIAGYLMLPDKWQWTMYWSPFYWAYRANDQILKGIAEWSEVLVSMAIIWGISLLVYLLALPFIKKGLV